MIAPVLCWFRQDLRLSDNPAWAAACAAGLPVIPVYIQDDINSGLWKMGGASRVWLKNSLEKLDQSLHGNLLIVSGDASEIIPALVKKYQVNTVFWNRCYELWRIKRDTSIKKSLEKQNARVQTFNGSLLWEPWDVKKQDGTPYKIFTPFYRKGCLAATPPREPLPEPKRPAFFPTGEATETIPLSGRFWGNRMMAHWSAGEKAAQKKLEDFLEERLSGYKDGRNYPARKQTSRLSPHLHFGEISPNQVWHAAGQTGMNNDLDCFLSEMAWREFSYSLLYYNPDLPEKPLNRKFEQFAWENPNPEFLEKWQKGQTGFPIIDAGMRELWETGYMHNRVRMVVASFLVKNLRYHWRNGEDWFWDTLVDADLANNAASWQWVAGCGADAAPYFRIFNPITQGEKFDPNRDYINHWAPDSHKIKPIIDIKTTREKALAAFKEL